jgi:hypothetical protein
MASYPYPTPLAHDAAEELCAGAEAFAAIRGAFLCFVMIPREERMGEWRFAGRAESPAEAAEVLDSYIRVMGLDPEGSASPALVWLNAGAMQVSTDVGEAWSYRNLPLARIGKHEVVLLAEGQAPYDDCGLCILEVPSLDGSPFASLAPEIRRPRSWDDDYAGAGEDEDDDD